MRPDQKHRSESRVLQLRVTTQQTAKIEPGSVEKHTYEAAEKEPVWVHYYSLKTRMSC